MKFKTIGRTGVKVSQLCFGTMSFGATTDEAEAKAIFDRCLEAGINFFDCANVYAGGKSEEILGGLIKGCRDDLVITTKVAAATGGRPYQRGLSRRHIRLEVEKSLKRLATDRLDFYLVHHFDDDTPIEETLHALDQLVQQGQVLYLGVSNWAAWQIAKALGISAREGLARFECIQPMYSLVKRQAEVEILPLALSEQLGVIPYSPLGAGLLSGKYGKAKKPAQGRLVEDDMYMRRYSEAAYYQIAEDFTSYAEGRGVHPATLAVSWVMSHPAVTAPIIGARNVQQLEALLPAADLEMSEEWRVEISSLSVEPPPATDRSETRTMKV